VTIRGLLFGLATLATAAAAAEPQGLEPAVRVYATRGNVELTAHVFTPQQRAAARSAIVILHGGGWAMGDPSWGYGPARRFAAQGMVAICGQYRLSGREHPGVTPLDAMADARALLRWVRAQSGELGIDRERIAAYGWSAGAHLVAAAAIWHDVDGKELPSCVPDAMILESPALSLQNDAWIAQLLGERTKADDVSPDRHVRAGMPPTLILQGRTDTVTPLAGTQAFHDAMLANKNESELVIYDGVGHLFTPATESDQGWPNPDPAVSRAAQEKMTAFLRARGFLDAK
jgi:acetyl esterase/lipase